MNKASTSKRQKSGNPFWRVVLMVTLMGAVANRMDAGRVANDFWNGLNGECATTAGYIK